MSSTRDTKRKLEFDAERQERIYPRYYELYTQLMIELYTKAYLLHYQSGAKDLIKDYEQKIDSTRGSLENCYNKLVFAALPPSDIDYDVNKKCRVNYLSNSELESLRLPPAEANGNSLQNSSTLFRLPSPLPPLNQIQEVKNRNAKCTI